MATDTRATVIANAIEAATKEAEEKVTPAPVVEDKQEAKKEEPVVEEKTETLKPEVDELAEQGKLLIQGLRDPAKAGAIIEFLAKQGGYVKPSDVPLTNTEIKEKTNTILDELKEGFGEEFSVIAERLAPALEKIINREVQKSQADIREEFQKQATEKLQAETSSALTKLTTNFFGEGEKLPENVEKEISNFMDKHLPSADISAKEYMSDAFDYAVGKLGLTKVNPDKKARVDRGRNDASSHLASARVPAESQVAVNSKPMSRQEAIKAALEAVAKDN